MTKLHLLGNQITDDGFSILMPFLEKDGKLSGLTEFSIGSGVTDKGMKEFADILAIGALATAIGNGALPKLTKLNLHGNPGNYEPAMKALRNRKA